MQLRNRPCPLPLPSRRADPLPFLLVTKAFVLDFPALLEYHVPTTIPDKALQYRLSYVIVNEARSLSIFNFKQKKRGLLRALWSGAICWAGGSVMTSGSCLRSPRPHDNYPPAIRASRTPCQPQTHLFPFIRL